MSRASAARVLPSRGLVAALGLALATALASAGEPGDDELAAPGAARARLRGLGRERASAFVGIALGSVVGLACASALHMLWRRRPFAARSASGVLLALATARLLGEVAIGAGTPSVAATGIAWVFLAGVIASVFRTPRPAARPARPPWLRVPLRPREETGRPRERPPAAERPEPGGTAVEEALALVERGEIDAAVEALRRGLAERESKRARLYLGTILGARGEREAALGELDRALALDPAYAEALSEKALILGELGRAEEAAAVRERLRSARSARAWRKESPSEITTCPACGKGIAPGSESCECGLSLRRCGVCGAESGSLRPRGGRLVCMRCRSLEAASHAKTGALVERALSARETPPWVAAAVFAGAVALGAVASPGYVAGLELAASRAQRSLLADVASALERSESAGPAPDAEIERLESRAAAIIDAHAFARDRAASLRTALALHALRRSAELWLRGDAEAARFVSGWGSRQVAQALAALDAGERSRMPRGLSRTFADMRDAFERELESRLRRAAEIAESSSGRPAPASRRDWRSIWARPGAGTTFLIEVFKRVSVTAAEEAVVGAHKDGSPVAAAGLLRCTVAPGDGFVLLVERVPFEVRRLDAPPEGLPPDARLVPSEPAGADAPTQGRPHGPAPRVAARGSWRIEFSEALRFRLLADLAAPQAGIIATDESLYAARELPARDLPFFAPGLDGTWAQDETLLWPYKGASPERGPCVKQIARWLTGPDGRERVSLAWLLRYEPATKKYFERIVQSWTCGRIWWDFYDDEVAFFRTVFPAPPAPQADAEAPGAPRGEEGGSQ